MQNSIKRIVSVSIICVGIIASVWIFSKNKGAQIISLGADSKENVSDNIPRLYDQNDWEKILVNIDRGTTTIASKLTTGTYPGEGTLTDQMSKDFLSQYLSLKQNGNSITENQIDQIIENILSSPEYTKSTGVRYTTKDLHIDPKIDKATVSQYMNAGASILIKYSNKNYGNEWDILEKATKTGAESDLAKLDPIIKNYKSIISEFLGVSVPNDAVSFHLSLLNSISNLLSNAEGIRVAFTDPIRGFAGMSQYKQHYMDMVIAVENLGQYFKSKGVN